MSVPGMIGAFLTWWLDHLAQLLPGWLRRQAFARVDAIVITPTMPLDHAGTLAFVSRRNGKETPLGEFPARPEGLRQVPPVRGQPVVLRIERAELLEKTLSLPLAARGQLDQALAFEMDRETPFATDELYWNYHIERIDQSQQRLSVHLVLIPKARLTPLLTVLSQADLRPKWVEVADAPAAGAFLPLDDHRGPPQHRSRLVLAGAAACCITLAVGAALTPFIRQQVELASFDREIQAGQSIAAETDALRREADRLSRSAEFVRSAKEKSARPLEVLASVTQLLPDDTYLTEIELRQRKLTVSGRSAGAARLIGTFAADSRFRNPSFAAPVTRVESLRADVFTIVAEIGPEP
jgi:general secretion pathway protein L